MSADPRRSDVPLATQRLRDRIQQDALVTRRDYLRLLVTLSGGLLGVTGAIAAGLFRRHGAGEAPPLRIADRIDPGGAAHFRYPGDDDPAIAIRLPDGELVAYSSVCTHLACAVVWHNEALECPCHEGVFNPRNGGVLSGPPPRPLTAVRLEERPDGVFAVESLG